MAVAMLADEAMGAVRAALRAVDDSMKSLSKHRTNLCRVLERLEQEQTNPDTCEFGRYDEVGNTIEECQRTDYEEVAMFDGGVVRLCPKHRSWGPSLGRTETGE